MITSLQNDKIKLAHALQTSAKSRRKSARIVLEGVRLIADALAQGYAPDFILHDADFPIAELERLTQAPLTLLLAAPEIMRHICDTEQPQGALGVFPMPEHMLPSALTRLLILDGVRDPGNLGTMLRTATAAGVDGVLLSPDCVDAYNPKALRAGMGAHFRVPLAEQAWDAIRAMCAGLTVYLADMDGDIAYDAADWTQPHALIIGGEAHGASTDARDLAAQRIYIPMSGATESLNAAAAAAVLLFEGARARRQA
ncbi:MAG: RNA methyltransferase [Chloroflexota bacterium]|nr:RNA methyltransferase [Chloroflexota bacterium]